MDEVQSTSQRRTITTLLSTMWSCKNNLIYQLNDFYLMKSIYSFLASSGFDLVLDKRKLY